MDTFWEVLRNIVDGEEASTLSLSKGGWEGWLQCELWLWLTDEGVTVEREVPYPEDAGRCDLVVEERHWVELKAFGIFREKDERAFVESFLEDICKLESRPSGTSGLALLVVLHALNGALIATKRKEHGLTEDRRKYVTLLWKQGPSAWKRPRLTKKSPAWPFVSDSSSPSAMSSSSSSTSVPLGSTTPSPSSPASGQPSARHSSAPSLSSTPSGSSLPFLLSGHKKRKER